MKVNLDDLTEDQLIDLNHRIVERLRMLRDLKAHVSMMDFNIGEKVMFHPEGRDPVYGTLIKYNRKSVTVIADGGTHWKVAPGFLKKILNKSQGANSPSSKSAHFQLSLIKN